MSGRDLYITDWLQTDRICKGAKAGDRIHVPSETAASMALHTLETLGTEGVEVIVDDEFRKEFR
ncbi:MAG TPA: hypothetical protein VH643_18595 [Gemmataceae bacterium]|jgi:hypothetical protein